MGQDGSRQLTPLLRRVGRATLIALPLLFLGLFFYYPLAGLVQSGLSSNTGFTLDRLTRIFSDSYLRHVLLFTAWEALLSTLASVALEIGRAHV